MAIRCAWLTALLAALGVVVCNIPIASAPALWSGQLEDYDKQHGGRVDPTYEEMSELLSDSIRKSTQWAVWGALLQVVELALLVSVIVLLKREMRRESHRM